MVSLDSGCLRLSIKAEADLIWWVQGPCDHGFWMVLGPQGWGPLSWSTLKLFLPELLATCSPSYNRLSSWGHRHIFHRSSERNEWIPCPGAGCDCGLPCFGALPVQTQHVEGVKDGGPSTCTGGWSSTLNTLRNHRSSRVWVFYCK